MHDSERRPDDDDANDGQPDVNPNEPAPEPAEHHEGTAPETQTDDYVHPDAGESSAS